jgi:FlgD Ig-like domain
MRRGTSMQTLVLVIGLTNVAAAQTAEPSLEILLENLPVNDVVQVRPAPPVILGPGADVIASITASAVRDPDGAWTYRYKVFNAQNSPRGIWSLTLEPISYVVSMSGPAGWRTDPAFQAPGQVNWFCVDTGPNPPDNNGNVSPSPFDIAPGDSAVFTLRSPDPPTGSTNYFIQGFHEIPVLGTEATIDSALDSQGSFLDDALTGSTLGPGLPSGVGEEVPRSETSPLAPVHPNPISSYAAFGFVLDKPAYTRLLLYDTVGRLVRVLLDGDQPLGTHVVTWDVRDSNGMPVSTGVYFYQLELDGKAAGARKALVIR